MREDPSTYPFWADEREGGLARLGLAESFLENLGDDPIAVELASPGARIRPGETLGFIYTPEQPYELRAPRALEIVAVNEAAESDPRLVKLAPYGRGWLLEIKWCR